MSDDEYDDELPWISMDSSVKNSDVLSMPSAEILASQRAREVECEQELMKLRAHHDVATLTDSSGSEGEAALAAAVSALVMAGGANVPPFTSPLPALLKRITPAHAAAMVRATPDILEMLTDEVCGAVESECLYSEEEVVFVAAYLCVRGAVGAGRWARRALHRLLESNAFHDLSEASFESLSRALLETREPMFLRVEMADVLSAAVREEECQSIRKNVEGINMENVHSIGKNGEAMGEKERQCIAKNAMRIGERERQSIGKDMERMSLGEGQSIAKDREGMSEEVAQSIGKNGEEMDVGVELNICKQRCATLALRLLADTVSQLLEYNAPQSATVSSCLCSWACEAVLARWRAVEAARTAECVRALGRLLRSCPRPARCRSARARLLRHCAAPAHHAHQHHTLEMLVNARKLQLLIRD